MKYFENIKKLMLLKGEIAEKSENCWFVIYCYVTCIHSSFISQWTKCIYWKNDNENGKIVREERGRGQRDR